MEYHSSTAKASAATKATKVTKATTSSSNHGERYHRPQYQLLSKEKLVGPVTALALETFAIQQKEKISIDVCLIGRGPYVTVVPLENANSADKSDHLEDEGWDYFAFGRYDAESGTVHGIHKVSHCISSDTRGKGENVVNNNNFLAFHGGKKVSFAYLDIVALKDQGGSKPVETGDLSLNMTSFRIRNSGQCKLHLSLTDWIWDVRVIVTDDVNDDNQQQSKDDNVDKFEGMKFLTALGMAQNVVEIWSLSSHRSSSQTTTTNNCSPTLDAIKLRKIICEKRCITYSLSFYGWKNDYNSHTRTSKDLDGNDLQLAVAVGTVSNQILIWNAITNEEGNKILDQYSNSVDTDDSKNSLIMVKKSLAHTLSGHLGVIYSCKFGNKGQYIVSTSDDRTVRLWKRKSIAGEGEKDDDKSSINRQIDFGYRYEMSSDVEKVINTNMEYNLQWTGFSHAARVWDSDFIAMTNDYESFNGIISSGEDATLKIWNADDGSLVQTLKGHSCQSIWKVCSSSKRMEEGKYAPFLVSGANDGSVNIWNTTYHVSKNYQNCETFKLSESPQGLCGICFYPLEGGKKLLTTTRDGQVNTLNLESKEWIYHGEWSCSTEEGKEVNTEFGSCVEIHPTLSLALIGTTKGDIVLFSSINSEKVAYSASKYLAIQSISWLDHCNYLVFHVKGIVTWWEIDISDELHPSQCNCRMKRVLKIKAPKVGVPMSHYYDKQEKLMFLGDSRGNIALFDCEKSECNENGEQYPTDVMVYAHKKEHVTSIIPTNTNSCRGILSAGNDGHLNETTIVKEGGEFKMQRSLSRPISNLTGVSCLWRSNSGALLAGGYHGNQFVIVDVNTNRQLLNIETGGRNRRMIIWLELQNHLDSTLQFASAICVANKKAPFEIITHSNLLNCSNVIPSIPQQLNIPFHGETIFDVALCNMNGKILVVSGSNDCGVKLSLVTKSKVSLIKDLPPHETCIRAVSISHHLSSSSSIIAVCGAKLITTFYRIDMYENGEMSVHFLCTTMLPLKPSIDHRINGVKAIPLSSRGDENSLSHLVLAGDSDGGLHLTILTEELGQNRKVSSRFLTQDSRPILSLDVLRISDNFFVSFVGTTAGKVAIWLLSQQPEGEIQSQESPLHSYDAHTMGANCISARVVSTKTINDLEVVRLLICTGGDDQAISIQLLSLSIPSTPDMSKVSIETLASYKKAEACGSAIKGIDVTGDESTGFRVFTSGYDQRVGIWALHIDPNDLIRFGVLSSTPMDIKDINTLGCCVEENKEEGTITEHVVAGGEGLEVVSFQRNIWQAAHALRRCNNLLITCGAGFSADSGLATYENMPDIYKDLCNPLRLVDTLNAFQQFWLDFAKQYNEIVPHRGYDILASWCGEGRLKNLSASTKPWWIYSSNVDGHFDNFECFQNTICEIHGRATEFRCANQIGFSDGIRRDGDSWDKWNDACSDYLSNEKCNNEKIDISEINQEIPLLCPQSKIPMRPNVLMFHDTDKNVLNDIAHKRQLYQEWEANVEDKVINEDQHLVILELGAGQNVTAIRDESEEVFHDVLHRLKEKIDSKGSVTLIRINPKDSCFRRKPDLNYPGESIISINEKAQHALLMIDQILSNLEEG